MMSLSIIIYLVTQQILIWAPHRHQHCRLLSIVSYKSECILYFTMKLRILFFLVNSKRFKWRASVQISSISDSGKRDSSCLVSLWYSLLQQPWFPNVIIYRIWTLFFFFWAGLWFGIWTLITQWFGYSSFIYTVFFNIRSYWQVYSMINKAKSNWNKSLLDIFLRVY
jgi:hypothetical protein